MVIKRFEDIIAWQKAQDLAVEIYSHFGQSRDFGFKDQICRAVVSISNNIAEGFERRGDKQFIHFLYIALGSCSEVRSMSYLAKRLNYIDDPIQSEILEQCHEINRLLYGLIKSIKK